MVGRSHIIKCKNCQVVLRGYCFRSSLRGIKVLLREMVQSCSIWLKVPDLWRLYLSKNGHGNIAVFYFLFWKNIIKIVVQKNVHKTFEIGMCKRRFFSKMNQFFSVSSHFLDYDIVRTFFGSSLLKLFERTILDPKGKKTFLEPEGAKKIEYV